jgi:hypothetical protein
MPRYLAMPSLSKLRPGARRDFVENLFRYLKVADRPTLREISARINERDDLPGDASTETVRRMLRGETVLVRWNNAVSVFLVLCELAAVNPDDDHWDSDDGWGQGPTHMQVYRAYWNAALDEPPGYAAPALPADEPPF